MSQYRPMPPRTPNRRPTGLRAQLRRRPRPLWLVLVIHVVVLGLSEERRCFAEASKLYQETPESIARREKDAEARRINAYFSPRPDEKPDKKQRRELLRLKNSFGDEE